MQLPAWLRDAVEKKKRQAEQGGANPAPGDSGKGTTDGEPHTEYGILLAAQKGHAKSPANARVQSVL